MDFNEYALEQLVRDRLHALREASARRRLTPAAPIRLSVRERAGHALIRVGRWLVASAPRPDPSGAPAER